MSDLDPQIFVDLSQNMKKLIGSIDNMAKDRAFGGKTGKKTSSAKQEEANVKGILTATKDLKKRTVELAKQKEEEAISTKKKVSEEEKSTRAMNIFNKVLEDSTIPMRELSKQQLAQINKFGTLDQKTQAYMATLPTVDKMVDNTLKSTFKNVQGKLGGFGKALSPLSKHSMAAATAIAGVGLVAGALAGVFMNAVDASRGVIASGVAFDDTTGTIAGAGMKLNMSMDQFSSLVANNAKTFALAGTSLITQASRAGKEMQSLGLTTSEGAEYLAEYANTQRRLGMIESLGTRAQMMGAQQLLAQTNELSMAFGVAVDDIKEQIFKSFDDPMVRSALLTIPEDMRASVAESFKAGMAGFAAVSPEIANMFSDMFGSAVPQVSKSFQEIIAAGAPGVATAMAQFANGIKSGTISAENQEQARLDMMRQIANQDIVSLRFRASAGDAAASALLAQVLEARESVRQWDSLSNEDRASRLREANEQREATARLTNFSQSMSNFGEKVLGAFLEGMGSSEDIAKMIGELAVVASDAAKALGKVVSVIGGFITSDFGKITLAVAGVLAGLALFKKTLFVISKAQLLTKGITKGLGELVPSSKSMATTAAASPGSTAKSGGLLGKAGGLLGKAGGLLGKTGIFTVVIGAIGGIIEGVQTFIGAIEEGDNIVKALIKGLGGVVKGFFTTIITGFTGIIDAIFGTNFTDKFVEMVEQLSVKISDFVFGIPGKIADFFFSNEREEKPAMGMEQRRNQRNFQQAIEQDQDDNSPGANQINTARTRRDVRNEQQRLEEEKLALNKEMVTLLTKLNETGKRQVRAQNGANVNSL